MFINQAAGAIENSKTYEDTLILTHTDTLTACYNHGYFQYRLDEEIIKAKSQGHKISILMIDIDNFKKFNDTFGHQAGDEVLSKVAKNLQNYSRTVDIVCRYGGDEFTIILPDTSCKDAYIIAKRIQLSMHNYKIENCFFRSEEHTSELQSH